LALMPMRRSSTAHTSLMVAIVSIALNLALENALRFGFGSDLYSYDLPIACVEGWSTTQRWSGVRLRDLSGLAGLSGGTEVTVESLQQAGALRRVTLSADQVGDEQSLLALRVNGVDLSLDHGFPARIIVPNNPGVRNTKWVRRLTFENPT